MTFEEALGHMRKGHVLARPSWIDGWTCTVVNGGLWCADGKGNYDRLHRSDIMAEDWEVVSWSKANVPRTKRELIAFNKQFRLGGNDVN